MHTDIKLILIISLLIFHPGDSFTHKMIIIYSMYACEMRFIFFNEDIIEETYITDYFRTNFDTVSHELSLLELYALFFFSNDMHK